MLPPTISATIIVPQSAITNQVLRSFRSWCSPRNTCSWRKSLIECACVMLIAAYFMPVTYNALSGDQHTDGGEAHHRSCHPAENDERPTCGIFPHHGFLGGQQSNHD